MMEEKAIFVTATTKEIKYSKKYSRLMLRNI